MQSRAELPVTVVAASGCAVPPEIGLVRAKGFVRSADGKVISLQVVGRRWTATKAMRHALCRVVCIGAKPEFDPQERRRIVSHHVL